MTEELELWTRDPLECIKELMANPAFAGNMTYSPVQMFSDSAGTVREFKEMWTGDWWWKTQV